MNYEKLISDVNLAFAGNQFEVSLKKAQEAINKDDSKAEGYVCAGKAALSSSFAQYRFYGVLYIGVLDNLFYNIIFSPHDN